MVSDEELVARTLHGDAPAFGSLLRRHQRAILAFCRQHVGDFQEAEDLAQEAFLRAYFDLHALREPAKFAQWTRAIALRLCQSWHRRRREMPLPVEQLACERQRMVSKTPLETATDLLVREAVTALPDSYQDVIVLRYFEGRTQGEVASLLGIPVETVHTRLRRAKDQPADPRQRLSTIHAATPSTLRIPCRRRVSCVDTSAFAEAPETANPLAAKRR